MALFFEGHGLVTFATYKIKINIRTKN